MDQNDKWAQALDEAQDPEKRDKGLWARSFAEAAGDEPKAQAAYVKAKVGAGQQAGASADYVCPACKKPVAKDAKSCVCGASFEGISPYAWKPEPTSPNWLPSDSNLSNIQQPQVVIVKSQKSRGAYIIIGLFFGLLGIHNFYAGRYAIGLAQLLTTVILGWFVIGLAITAFWVIVELFVVKKDGRGDDFI